MIDANILQKVELLFNQSRFEEAKALLEQYLTDNPTEYFGRMYYVTALLNCGENDKARQLCDVLVSEYPDRTQPLLLSTKIDLDDEYYIKAESKIDLLKEMASNDSEVYLLESEMRLGQRNYDKALAAVKESLALEPNNLQAVNLKILIDGILGDNTDKDVKHALNLDPENASTKANHALQLLNQGKVDEALERVHEAMSQDPTNPMARYVLAQAMKSKFWLFRMFYKLQQRAARLTANGSWVLVIGSYIAYQIILSLSETYPFLLPLVYLILAFFILSWLVNSIFNLYLYSNKYGRQLLDKDDKTMAIAVGVSLSIALCSLIGLMATGMEIFELMSLMFVIFAIPLGSFLSPTNKSNQNKLMIFTAAVILSGLLSLVVPMFFIITLFLFLGYQFYANSLLIKENARVM